MRPVALMMLLAAAAIGCGRRAGPDVQFVSGTVLLDGSPIEGAFVSFHPAAGGIAAQGLTKADGSFRLTSGRGGSPNGGAVAGDYVVTVVKWLDENPPAPPEPLMDEPDYAKKKKAWDAVMAARKPVVSLVPERSMRVETSDLEATVQKGRNEFRFELKSR